MVVSNNIYEALDNLDNDTSEMGRNIKGRISNKMKKWVKMNKKAKSNEV